MFSFFLRYEFLVFFFLNNFLGVYLDSGSLLTWPIHLLIDEKKWLSSRTDIRRDIIHDPSVSCFRRAPRVKRKKPRSALPLGRLLQIDCYANFLHLLSCTHHLLSPCFQVEGDPVAICSIFWVCIFSWAFVFWFWFWFFFEFAAAAAAFVRWSGCVGPAFSAGVLHARFLCCRIFWRVCSWIFEALFHVSGRLLMILRSVSSSDRYRVFSLSLAKKKKKQGVSLSDRCSEVLGLLLLLLFLFSFLHVLFSSVLAQS